MSTSFTHFVAVAVLSLNLTTVVLAQPAEAGDEPAAARTAQASDDDFNWGWLGLLGLLGLAGLLPRQDRTYDRSRNSGSTD